MPVLTRTMRAAKPRPYLTGPTRMCGCELGALLFSLRPCTRLGLKSPSSSSNDKTPYKKNFSASFSRAGRKGPFAGYYLQISPNGRSLLAGGKWGPEKNDLATIRSNILRSSKPLRKVINDPKFVSLFGPAKLPAGKKAPSNSAAGISRRCNVFGSDDMLKVAPKINGVDKSHKDIDLLRLRTIAVVYECVQTCVPACSAYRAFTDYMLRIRQIQG